METDTQVWPIEYGDVLDAQNRIRRYIRRTPFRNYKPLDEHVGAGITVWVKHENHNPTNSFKVRNGLSVMTALTREERDRGVVAATRGNHGQGVAWAGRELEVPVTVVVPYGNNPEKNTSMRAQGAEVIEEGRDYDESIKVAEELVRAKGMRMVHSTNDPLVLAGAATVAAEMIEFQPHLDAIVVQVGGGSLALGALLAKKALNPALEVYAVQAANAPGQYESWKAGARVEGKTTNTFADGIATRCAYELTRKALKEGLDDFTLVSEAEIAEALRVYLRTTHNLVEGASAVGLAGLMNLRERLEAKTVGLILSGSNIDQETLRKVLNKEI